MAKIEYCRNFIFKRNFPIHKIFERSCELGLWRLTAHNISEIFGVRVTRKLKGKPATVGVQVEHQVSRAHCKHAFIQRHWFWAVIENGIPTAVFKDNIGREQSRPSAYSGCRLSNIIPILK